MGQPQGRWDAAVRVPSPARRRQAERQGSAPCSRWWSGTPPDGTPLPLVARDSTKLKLTRFRGEANPFAAASVVSAVHPVVCAFDGRPSPKISHYRQRLSVAALGRVRPQSVQLVL